MMTLRQAAFLRLCFPTANAHSDYILKEYGAEHFLSDLKRGAFPLFLTKSDLRHIKEASAKRTDAMLEAAKAAGQQVIFFDDPAYPDLLREMPASPILLFCQGDVSLLKAFSICVVGSRRVSDYGLLSAATLAYQLASAGVCVVSGFARGCDSAAHKGALAAGGKTIAVCGCALDMPYPTGNEALREELLKKGGLMLSEYPPGTAAHASFFPVRNRILSGLSHGVLLAEAAEQSGAMITVSLAEDMNRDVFVVPNSIFDANAKGSVALMKEGAKPVATGADILEEYRLLPEYNTLKPELAAAPAPITFADVAAFRDGEAEKPKSHSVPARQKKVRHKAAQQDEQAEEKPVFSEEKQPDLSALSSEARSVYELLSAEPMALPELEDALEQPVSVLFEAVTELELAGLIRSLPGRRYLRRETEMSS